MPNMQGGGGEGEDDDEDEDEDENNDEDDGGIKGKEQDLSSKIENLEN